MSWYPGRRKEPGEVAPGPKSNGGICNPCINPNLVRKKNRTRDRSMRLRKFGIPRWFVRQTSSMSSNVVHTRTDVILNSEF